MRSNLATYYYLSGNSEEAMKLVGQVLKENPEYTNALYLMANSYLAAGNEIQARAIWQHMLDLGGSAASMARATMADAAQSLDNLGESTRQLEYGLITDAEMSNAYETSRKQILLAELYRVSGNRTALANSLSKVGQPSAPELIFLLGRVQARSGHLTAADRQLRRLEEASYKTPSVSSFSNMLQSEMAIAQNRRDDAVRFAFLAVQNLNSPMAIENLARAYDFAGNKEAAVTQYEALLARSNERQVDASDGPALHAVVTARYRLGVLYQALGRTDLAQNQFHRVLSYDSKSQATGHLYEDTRKRLAQINPNLVAPAGPPPPRTESTH